MRSLIRAPLWALAVCVLLAGAARARADEAPLAGNWKVTVLSGGQEITVWLVQIEEKGGKATGKVLSVGLEQFKSSKIDSLTVKGDTVRLNMDAVGNTFKIVARAAKGDKAPKTLLGSVSIGGQGDYVRLDRTDATELNPKEAIKTTPSQAAFIKALKSEDREEGFKEFLKENAKDPLAEKVAVELLKLLAKKKDAKAEDLKAVADQAIKAAEAYGTEAKVRALSDVAGQLLKSKEKDTAALALTYARLAQELVAPAEGPAAQMNVLQTLSKALVKAGKEDEAKELKGKIAKLNESLDEEFEKTAVPFKVESFAGRKGKGDRTVVLELFTGSECPPCVSADVAFDALLKTYKAQDVVLLQYHLHIPRPDPLTNADSEARAKFYGIDSTPSVIINGKEGPPAGGRKPQAEAVYDKLREGINERLGEEAQGKVTLKATRRGEKLALGAEVSGLKKTGKGVRLRFVLAEEVARYPGGNGQRLHHHVVRAFPGGEEGFALEEKDGKHKATVDLKELHKSLSEYVSGKGPYRNDEWPLELSHLIVVALVQDNDSREILAAAQVDLPGAKVD